MGNSGFLMPLFVAAIWATGGCLFVRAKWSVSYDFLCAFFLMTVFAFTFANKIVFLEKLQYPESIFYSGLAFFTPIFGRFGYSSYITESHNEPCWGRYVFGSMLLIFSTIFTLKSRVIMAEIQLLTGCDPAKTLIIFLAFTTFVGLAGVMTVINRRNSLA